MNRYFLPGLSLLTLGVVATIVIWQTQQQAAEAHCQVPCGIYDDAARVTAMREDAATIAKAIAQITDLAGRHDPQALNQATRWIMTKEQHASHIITVVSEYFLTQKIKPVAAGSSGYDAYLRKLADHHAVLTAAMKTKQTTDPASVAVLISAIDGLAQHYKTTKKADAGASSTAVATAASIPDDHQHDQGDPAVEHHHEHTAGPAEHRHP